MDKEERIKKKAKQRIIAKKAFFAHALIYAACVPLLIAINLMTLPEFWWWVFPVFGWGFLVTVHFIINYFLVGAHGAKWERQELEAEMERIEIEEMDKLDLDRDYTIPESAKIGDDDWDESDFV